MLISNGVENIRKFSIPAVVAINEFVSDTTRLKLLLLKNFILMGYQLELASVWADGTEKVV